MASEVCHQRSGAERRCHILVAVITTTCLISQELLCRV
jgi:hypothetical protein